MEGGLLDKAGSELKHAHFTRVTTASLRRGNIIP